MVTFNQLRIFLAVARREHMTKASEDINLSQSAVSMAVSDLEEKLKGPLFERTGRNLKLNDRGRLLQREASKILHQADDMVSLFTNDAGELHGDLKVGASSTIGNYLLPGIIGRFKERHPQVRIDLEIANTEQIESRLLDLTLDLGLTEGPVQHEDISSSNWLTDRLVVIAAPGYFDEKKSKLTVDELKQVKWIMREKGSGTRDVFERAIQSHAESIDIFLTFGHTEAVKQAVMAGLGVGCLSLYTVSREIERGNMIHLEVPEFSLERTLRIINREGSHVSRLCNGFCEFLKRETE
jgi:DNA-binding transcriptional LysR family regulator